MILSCESTVVLFDISPLMLKKSTYAFTLVLLTLGILVAVPACQTLSQMSNLRKVQFSIDRVTDASLAGVDLDSLRSYEDLSAAEMTRVLQSLVDRRAPMAFTLHLNAENPEENDASARLVEMDWTLLLDETETVGGTFNQSILLAPGEPVDVPIDIELDLFNFFERSSRDLVELALAVAGVNGQPKKIKLRATPVVETVIGRIRYPQPITIELEDVGS